MGTIGGLHSVLRGCPGDDDVNGAGDAVAGVDNPNDTWRLQFECGERNVEVGIERSFVGIPLPPREGGNDITCGIADRELERQPPGGDERRCGD